MIQVQTRRLHSIKSLVKINVMQEKLLTLKHVHVNLLQKTYATLTVPLSSLIHLSKIHTRSVSVSLWMLSMDLETILLELTAWQALKMTQAQMLLLRLIESLAKMSVMQVKLSIPKLAAVDLLLRIYVTLIVPLNSQILQSRTHIRSVNVSLKMPWMSLITIFLEKTALQELAMTLLLISAQPLIVYFQLINVVTQIQASIHLRVHATILQRHNVMSTVLNYSQKHLYRIHLQDVNASLQMISTIYLTMMLCVLKMTMMMTLIQSTETVKVMKNLMMSSVPA